jgi:hypothetical protein
MSGMNEVLRSRTFRLIYVVGRLLHDYHGLFTSRRNIEDVLRTIDSGRYFVVDALNSATDILNLVTDTGHSIIDTKRDMRNSPHSASVIDSMRSLQDLRRSHLSLLLRQNV